MRWQQLRSCPHRAGTLAASVHGLHRPLGSHRPVLLWAGPAFVGTRYHTGRTKFSMLVGPEPPTEEIRKWWSYNGGGVIAGTPAIGFDSTVYACSDNGFLHAINSSTGEKRWVYQATGYVVWTCEACALRGPRAVAHCA